MIIETEIDDNELENPSSDTDTPSEQESPDLSPNDSLSNPQETSPTYSSDNDSNSSGTNNNSVVLTPNNPDNDQTVEESIQELYRLLEAKDRQIEQLQQQINDLEEKLNMN